MLTGRIFLTGGSGFLARGIMRYARKHSWDCEFTVYSRNAEKQVECRAKYPDACYVLGDIRDFDRLSLAMLQQDIVIHTAALKHIPESESNVSECLSINVGGTATLIDAVRASNVHTCVGISTDKAVEPLNTYGLTKALGERLFIEASRQSPDRKWVQARYGNVVGSSGSVVPVFKRMAARENRVFITDANMTRFWISIDDAVELIVEAALNAPNGSIVIPSPSSMEIGRVASAVVPDAEQVITGLRPGEKMHEKLLVTSESPRVGPGGKDSYYLHSSIPNLSVRMKDFELTSDKPEGGWLSERTFLDSIADAETI